MRKKLLHFMIFFVMATPCFAVDQAEITKLIDDMVKQGVIPKEEAEKAKKEMSGLSKGQWSQINQMVNESTKPMNDTLKKFEKKVSQNPDEKKQSSYKPQNNRVEETTVQTEKQTQRSRSPASISTNSLESGDSEQNSEELKEISERVEAIMQMEQN